MANTIKHVAIHDISRTEGRFVVTHGKGGLVVTTTMQRVIDSLHDLYGKRSSKSHGKFSGDVDHYPTEKHLKAYVDGDYGDFIAFTHELMETLKMQASHRSASVGGHVFFAHFEHDARHFLLVAIINDKLGATLTRELDVRDVQHLDMDGFRFAGRINITGWVNREERYIGFLKGKGEVSEYFKAFLGCDTTVQARQDTTTLVGVLKEFADAQGMDVMQKDAFLTRAKAICDRSSKAREEISFDAFANELVPDEPDSLKVVLADPERRLNDGFVPDRRALGSLVKFKGKTSLWTLEFDREAISSEKIRYDPEGNTLTLTDLPDDLSAQLRSDYNSDG